MSIKDLNGKNDPRLHLNAFVHVATDRWHLYATGYRRAAELIVEKLPTVSGMDDCVIYPLIFLYRHSVELWLKNILLGCSRLLGQRANVQTIHHLNDLWNEISQRISEIEKENLAILTSEEREFLDRVHLKLRSIQDFDKNSTVCRYPVDKKEEIHLSDVQRLHVGEISDYFRKMLDDLEGFAAWIDSLVDAKHEWMSSDQGLY